MVTLRVAFGLGIGMLITKIKTGTGVFRTLFYLPYLAPPVAFVDQAVAGDPFNIAFLEAFSGHHATLIPSSQECTAAASHADVQAYCAGIVASQTRQIGEMRNELATAYGITSVSYETVPLPAGIPASPVPEPASAAMFMVGLLGLGVAVRRARASAGGVLQTALSVH